MYHDSIIDQLEIEFGRAILSELTGQELTHNGQKVRLFDQTKHSSEVFYKTGDKGKPYIQDYNSGTRSYPFTAYCKIYGVDAATAIEQLRNQYGVGASTSTRARPRQRMPIPEPVCEPVTFIPAEVYEPCRSQFERNGLFVHLSSFFESELAARRIFDRYRIGTSRLWRYAEKRATTLPQFDIAGNLRQVKIIAFHPKTGKRAQKDDYAERWNERTKRYEPETREKVWFIGKQLAGTDKPNLQQCYFGEHLLAEDPSKPVALVEGESTALPMSEIWPEYNFLATGGATGGSWDDPEKFAVFRGRKVVLFPDSGKLEDWTQRAEKLRGVCATLNIDLSVSPYVEDNAPGTNLDLRDLITESYPESWDEPNAAGARPSISEKTVEPYCQQPSAASLTVDVSSSPSANEPVCSSTNQLPMDWVYAGEPPVSLRGTAYDVAQMQRIFWSDWPAPPRIWNYVLTRPIQ